MSQSRNLRRLYSKNIRPHYPAVKRSLRGLLRRQTIAIACLLLAVCFVLGADYYKSAAILRTSKEVVVADKRQSVNWQDLPKILIDKRTGKRIDPQDAVLGGGDTCGSASVIGALPFNDNGTTAGTTDNYKLPPDTVAPTVTGCPTCNAVGGGPAGAAPRGGVYTGTMTGPDVAYSITFTSANNSLDVTMTPTGGQDLALVVYTDVCSNNLADAIVVDDDGVANAAEHVTISNMPAGTYNIVVDGYSTGGTPPGPSGPYTLAVTGTGTIGTGATPTASPSPTNTATATATGSPAPTCTPANFANTAAITIEDNLPASPYPSNITVAGLTGTVTKVEVVLNGMTHTFPDDVDVMVVGPGGQNTLLMSDAGGSLDITGVNLTFDDAAAGTIPDSAQIATGTFRPSNYDTTTDVFPAPAPPAGATVALSVFNGTNPNGTWSLYVRDDVGIDIGSISGGWALRITTSSCTAGTPTATSTGTPPPTSTATNTPTAQPSATPSCTPGVLFNNGPLVTNPTGGFNGAPLSALQTGLGLNVLGFTATDATPPFSLADDFVVPAGGWTINTVTLFGYQTGSTTTSTFDTARVQIWNGQPGVAGSTVVFGDLTTNRFASTSWTGIYRATDTAPTGSTRPIMATVANIGTTLPAGTYWLEFELGGTTASGPFVPPVTILGSVNKPGSNAVQGTTPGTTFAPVLDTGTAAAPQDIPFVLNGGGTCGTPTATSTGTPATPTATATSTATPTASPSCTPGAANFANAAPITIEDNLPASPYPSNITVAGLTGTVTKVEVVLNGMTHTFPDDVDVMVVGPGGQNTLLMSDAGGSLDITGVNLTFDDAAAGTIPDSAQIATGTFRPSNYDTTTDVFPAPAPPAGATVALSVFNGTNPNGTWSLYVRDDVGIDIGSISGGWALRITTTAGGCGTPTATSTSTSTATATATSTSTPGGVASVQFSSATYTEDESQTAAITVTRTGDLSGTTTVNFATSNGTATGGAACTSGVDYVSVAQAVTFAPNVTTQTVNVQICGDTLVESTQTVNLTLTGASVGSPATAVLNINDTANVFRNGTAICTTLGAPAAPYPSTISVSGGPIQIGALRVTFYDVTHTMPDNMDFLLVSPTGRQMILQSDAGGLVDLVNPVTITFADNAGQVLPDSAPLTTGLFEPTSWQPGQPSFPAPAPPAPYNEPGSTVGGTPSLMSVFGLSNANGTWSLYMRDDANLLTPAAITGCVNGGWGLEFLTSTAAQASISGRVVTADGQGIRNAKIVITGNSLAAPIIATTGSFGYYTIDGLATGETYVVTVNSQRYTFSTPSQVISLVANIADANFIADPQD